MPMLLNIQIYRTTLNLNTNHLLEYEEIQRHEKFQSILGLKVLT